MIINSTKIIANVRKTKLKYKTANKYKKYIYHGATNYGDTL